MLVDYISDLHLDFWFRDPDEYEIREFVGMLSPNKESEVLVIAGDLGHDHEVIVRVLTRFLDFHYSDILLVTGNHDMYVVPEFRERYAWNSLNRVEEMRGYCTRTPGMHFLDGDTVRVGDLKFGGCGMSWDKVFLERLEGPMLDIGVLNLYKRTINDAKWIQFGRGHFDPFKFFEDEKRKLREIKDADVIVTHAGPVTAPDMRERYKFDPSTTFFYFDGRDDLDRINPRVWVHGHTHDEVDFYHGETRVVCNPLGYPGENERRNIKTFSP